MYLCACVVFFSIVTRFIIFIATQPYTITTLLLTNISNGLQQSSCNVAYNPTYNNSKRLDSILRKEIS